MTPTRQAEMAVLAYLLILPLLMLALSGCTGPAAARWGDAGQTADLATTAVNLELRDREEGNPLLAGESLAVLVGIKLLGNVVLYRIADTLPPGRARDAVHYLRAGLGFAAAGYNMRDW